MGDLLGSPRVAPLFLGIAWYHSGLPLVVPMGSTFPSPSAIVDPVTRAQDTGRRNRVSGIFPRFLPHGRSHRLGTIGGNRRLYGRSMRKLWVETPGGGDGSRRGSVRTCFMRR